MQNIIVCTGALDYCVSDHQDYKPRETNPGEITVPIDTVLHYVVREAVPDLKITYVPCSFEELADAIDSVDGKLASIAFFGLEGLYETKDERIRIAELKSRMDELAEPDYRSPEFNDARARYLRTLHDSFVRFDDGQLYRRISEHANVPIVKYLLLGESSGFLLSEGVLLERRLPVVVRLLRQELHDLTPVYETFNIAGPGTGETVIDLNAYYKFISPEEIKAMTKDRPTFRRRASAAEFWRDVDASVRSLLDP